MKAFEELNIPDNLRYAKDHEWISPAKPHRVGVSDFAQDALGDLTFVELPEVGREMEKGDEFGTLESIKSVSSVYMPAGGKVVAVNAALADDPGLVNRDPYGEGWLIEVEPSDFIEVDSLMEAAAYKKQLEESGS